MSNPSYAVSPIRCLSTTKLEVAVRRRGILPKARQLTQKRLIEVLRYNPDTGVLRWRISRPGCVAGRVAGTITNGYRQIEIDYKLFKAARLA